MALERDRYTHGHHESVLRSHLWRTAENSAAFMVSLLSPGTSVLDVGCGPGTISADFAASVAPGLVRGVDLSGEVIDLARAREENRRHANLSFAVEDVYRLSAEDESYDVVYAHQVLQHLTDPVAALREMRRVLRRDGHLAVRDADFGTFVWWPDDERLTRWLELYHEVTAANGADAHGGRRLASWVAAAGFSNLIVTSSTWTFTSPEDRAWWGGLWADRVVESTFARHALDYELSSEVELASIRDAFRAWADGEEGIFLVTHGEVVATP